MSKTWPGKKQKVLDRTTNLQNMNSVQFISDRSFDIFPAETKNAKRKERQMRMRASHLAFFKCHTTPKWSFYETNRSQILFIYQLAFFLPKMTLLEKEDD